MFLCSRMLCSCVPGCCVLTCCILIFCVLMFQDVVFLMISSFIFGWLVSMLSLPPMFGFIVGGIVIGPSGLNVLKVRHATVQITFIFIDFHVCDFAFAFKTQNAPCVSRFKRVLFTDRFQFAF